MDQITQNAARYTAGFTIGLGLTPSDYLNDRVEGNLERATIGSGQWHYNVGVLTALTLSETERARLRAEAV